MGAAATELRQFRRRYQVGGLHLAHGLKPYSFAFEREMAVI
jgi:hypothetical protein